MSDCLPCLKNKVFSQQFNNQGEIVERKTENKEMKTINFEDGIYERTIKKNENKTFVQKLASATKAAVAVLNGTAFAVDEKIKNQRLKICSECEHIQRLNALQKGASVAIGDTCGICGCYLKGNRVTSLLNFDFCKVCYGGTPEFVCPLTDDDGNPTPKWGFEFGEFELNRQPETVEELSENLSEEKDL